MLKRIERYLKGRPRRIWRYDWQNSQEILDAHSDANWAGCRRSRNSSSGGTIALGNHLIKSHSKTQAIIAKSSGESELYGVIRASTESLGISTLLEDCGVGGFNVRVGMDANAAIGIVQRRGLNKLRHVELDVLWVQEQQARRLLPFRKVPGPLNPSDLMTKHVDQAHIEQYLSILNLKYAEGRATIAQKLHAISERDKPDNEHAHVRSAAFGYKSVGGVEPSGGRRKQNPELSEAHYCTLFTGELNRLHIDNYRP